MTPLRFRAKALDENLALVKFEMGDISNWIEADGVFYAYHDCCAIPCKIDSIQSSTGLFDKKGMEIFGGDIVGVPYVNPMGGIDNKWSYEAEVFYDFGCWWIKYLKEPSFPVPQQIIDWTEKSKGEYISNFGNPTIYQNKVRLEVIGNIYQNRDPIPTPL